MIVEQRTYRLVPGSLQTYLAIYEKEGLEIQTRHLGEPLGWYVVDIGQLNSVVHLWPYADHAERSEKRRLLATDAAWTDFLPKVTPLIQEMQSAVLAPAPFFKFRSS